MSNQIAPDGQVYICGACGKRSADRYGVMSTPGWDVSCTLHSVLVYEDSIKVKDGIVSATAVQEEKFNG